MGTEKISYLLNMKRSELKELIKQSMLEVSPKGGEMTPEEEKMVADYEEEEANKYALDKEEPLEEEASKAAAILNRPSNRMTFEQMGMIMMLADELGGEENAKANEFLSGVASKMEADKYIQELIAKIDGEENMLREADEIVAAWAEKQTLKEADLSQANFSDLHQVVKNIAHVNEVGVEEAAMQAIEYIAEQFDVPVDFKDF